jgi:hypothetical protein
MPAVRAMLPAGKLHGASNEPCQASQTRVPERGSFKDSFLCISECCIQENARHTVDKTCSLLNSSFRNLLKACSVQTQGSRHCAVLNKLRPPKAQQLATSQASGSAADKRFCLSAMSQAKC